jgi:hypothetical protein
MKLAKIAFLFVLGAAFVSPIVGCGVGTNQAESNRSIRRVVDYDARMMVDDLGTLTQTDRPFRGSKWIID